MSERFMRLAIKEAEKGISRLSGGPFGACIVKGKKVIAKTHNTVLKNKDATAHAEVNAIRLASKKLRAYNLKGCVIYSTTEPCPMCFSAIHWARIDKIFYGTNIADVKKLGFNEMPISVKNMKKTDKSQLKFEAGFMKEECMDLLKKWMKKNNKIIY